MKTMESFESFSTRCQQVLNQVHPTWILRAWQIEALYNVVVKKADVFLIAPTSSGKSLPIELIPLLAVNAKVFVVVPLIALQSTLALAFKSTRLGVLDTAVVSEIELASALNQNLCNHSYVLLSPERALQKKWLDYFRDHNDQIGAFVIDEAHCMYSWGLASAKSQAFRPEYSNLFKLRTFATTDVPIFAMTATATKKDRELAIKMLHMKPDTICLSMPFHRPNLYFCSRKYNGDNYNEPELVQLIDAVDAGVCQRTMIFCQTIAAVADVYELFSFCLNEKMFAPGFFNLPQNAIVNMMHSEVDQENKDAIISQLDNPDGCLKVIITTSSLALGVNTKGVRKVIHLGPPKCLPDYIQQCGRAGRESWMEQIECPVVILYSPTQLVHVTPSMKEYCKAEACRRRHLFSYLNPDATFSHPESYRCCDICNKTVE